MFLEFIKARPRGCPSRGQGRKEVQLLKGTPPETESAAARSAQTGSHQALVSELSAPVRMKRALLFTEARPEVSAPGLTPLSSLILEDSSTKREVEEWPLYKSKKQENQKETCPRSRLEGDSL